VQVRATARQTEDIKVEWSVRIEILPRKIVLQTSKKEGMEGFFELLDFG
jgi:hypothetical protein